MATHTQGEHKAKAVQRSSGKALMQRGGGPTVSQECEASSKAAQPAVQRRGAQGQYRLGGAMRSSGNSEAQLWRRGAAASLSEAAQRSSGAGGQQASERHKP